jgi:hypothetical protein
MTFSEGAPSLSAEPRRSQALHTGKWRYRTAKQPKLELPSTVETAPRVRETASGARKKPRTARKAATKSRKMT